MQNNRQISSLMAEKVMGSNSAPGFEAAPAPNALGRVKESLPTYVCCWMCWGLERVRAGGCVAFEEWRRKVRGSIPSL